MGKPNKRKPTKHVVESKFLRQAEDGEYYAAVTKLFGYGRMQVQTLDGKLHPCVIRKAFKRGHEHVQVGTFILTGPREFETNQEVYDLLEVYTSQELSRLQSMDPRLSMKSTEVLFTDSEPTVSTEKELKIFLNYTSLEETSLEEIDYDLI